MSVLQKSCLFLHTRLVCSKKARHLKHFFLFYFIFLIWLMPALGHCILNTLLQSGLLPCTLVISPPNPLSQIHSPKVSPQRSMRLHKPPHLECTTSPPRPWISCYGRAKPLKDYVIHSQGPPPHAYPNPCRLHGVR